MKAVVSEKGQVTIPKALRDKLGLRTGTVLEFDSSQGKLLAWKKVDADPFAKWRGRGKLPHAETVDGYLKRIRNGDRD